MNKQIEKLLNDIKCYDGMILDNNVKIHNLTEKNNDIFGKKLALQNELEKELKKEGE